MAKIELKAIVSEVGPIETLGEKGTKVQKLILIVPAYRDGWGDVKGKDEYWEVAVINDNIEKLQTQLVEKNLFLKDQRVIAELFINGSRVEKEGKIFYPINVTVHALKFVDL